MPTQKRSVQVLLQLELPSIHPSLEVLCRVSVWALVRVLAVLRRLGLALGIPGIWAVAGSLLPDELLGHAHDGGVPVA